MGDLWIWLLGLDGWSAVCLRGSFFGLHVDRPRYWITNFDLHLDWALLDGGAIL